MQTRKIDDGDYRIEKDTLGEVKVDKRRLWGAQTQRSYQNFPIGQGHEQMPEEIIEAFGYLKMSCAEANHELVPEKMTDDKALAIKAGCQKIVEGELREEFPLVVFQTGSGTQTNMNVNEVIARYANTHIEAMSLHPNDDINMSQSSNDTFPSAMHIAAVLSVEKNLIPATEGLIEVLGGLEDKFADEVKIGRTHLQDAVPISFGQEISGWRASLEQDLSMLKMLMEPLRELAIGGTAVGTGLNAPQGFDACVCKALSKYTGTRFIPSTNKFHALTSLDEMVAVHGVIKAMACDMMKMANDVRWLASGPRCGLGEISIPANEPGSSIMPGKVNPTQCEQVTMVCAQIIGNDGSLGFAASQGNFELNVFLPVTAYNFLQSCRLLSQSISSFTCRCVAGIEVNHDKMHENLYSSLMLCTCFAPYIGYEKAANLAKYAHGHQCDLFQANKALGYLDDKRFYEICKPEDMI